MKEIAVMGGGSLGLLLAAGIAAAGGDPVVWTRSEEQAAHLRREGITVEGTGGKPAVAAPVKALAYHDVQPGFSGVVLLALKQTSLTDDLLDGLSDRLANDAEVVLFQNGMGHADRAASALRGRRLAAAVTTEGALKIGPVSVRHTGRGETWLGAWKAEDAEAGDREAEDWLKALSEVLMQAGFSVSLSKEIRERMLRKLLINAVINPLSALWRLQNGELPADPGRKAFMKVLFLETESILRLHGLEETETAALWEQVLGVCVSTASNRSSMLQDVLAGRETEIGSLNGEVCRMAQASGRDAPCNAAVTALVQGIPSRKENGP